MAVSVPWRHLYPRCERCRMEYSSQTVLCGDFDGTELCDHADGEGTIRRRSSGAPTENQKMPITKVILMLFTFFCLIMSGMKDSPTIVSLFGVLLVTMSLEIKYSITHIRRRIL